MKPIKYKNIGLRVTSFPKILKVISSHYNMYRGAFVCVVVFVLMSVSAWVGMGEKQD